MLFSGLCDHRRYDISLEDSQIWANRYKYLYGLADCNNFYCSCHEVRLPHLKNVPHVAASNNDGCIISRSKLAKKLGYKMSENIFEIEDKLKRDGVIVFSSNYELYQSMSNRVFNFVSSYCADVERYSIDELFLLFNDYDQWNVEERGREIVSKTTKGTRIPICLGLGATKTLAKVANKLAKKRPDSGGVVKLQTEEEIRAGLIDFPVEDLWGIGPAYAYFLSGWNIYTALQLSEMPEHWVKQHMTVNSQRMWYELRGVSCIPLDDMPADKKNIRVSRSFAKPISEFNLVSEAIANHATQCAYKLRKDKLNTKALLITLETNKYRKDQAQLNTSILKPLDAFTNSTLEIVKTAIAGLKEIYKKGHLFKKCGVMAIDLVPEYHLQTSLFDQVNREADARLSKALDRINGRFGKGAVLLGSQGTDKRLNLRAENLCPSFTTRMSDIMRVRIS